MAVAVDITRWAISDGADIPDVPRDAHVSRVLSTGRISNILLLSTSIWTVNCQEWKVLVIDTFHRYNLGYLTLSFYALEALYD